MLLRGPDCLTRAAATHTALAGFVAYNLETAQGIVRAAELTASPVLLQAGSGAFRHAGTTLAELAVRLAAQSEASIGVHLDHSRSIEEIEACLSLGYTSVMIDGSHLDFEDNVHLTGTVVELAHERGAWVEGELGAIAGDEDVSTDALAGAMTDPEQAGEFVARTGVDALAVAVGNIHGYAPTEPAIDLDRLSAIREICEIPLVLHGASGLSAATLTACLDRGVVKVNVNTELRRAFLAAVGVTLPAAIAAIDLVTILAAGRDAVTETAVKIVEQLGHSDALTGLRPTMGVPQ